MAFELELLADDSDHRDKTREQIRSRIERFCGDYSIEHEDYMRSGEGKRMADFLDSLRREEFWKVLFFIDGSNDPHRKQSADERRTMRTRARARFSEDELQEVFTLVVNSALLPIQGPCTGSYRGHATLYREFIEKSDSMFGAAITPDFRKRLNNGRFWESLTDCDPSLACRGVPIVNDVLTSGYDDLSPSFAHKGMEILRREGAAAYMFTISYISSPAILNYGRFVSRLPEYLPQEFREALIEKYALAILEPADDVLRFENAAALLGETWLRPHLAYSTVRAAVGDRLLALRKSCCSRYVPALAARIPAGDALLRDREYFANAPSLRV